MATTKYYTDARGDKIAANYLSAYEKLRDKTALRIAKRWQEEQVRLQKIKAETVADIQALVDAAEKQADVSLGGVKGNVQFRSFDGNITIISDRQYRTEFDERLKLAEKLIEETIDEMTAKAEQLQDDELKQTILNLTEIARKAFKPRKSGNLDMQRIRDLRRYNVKHPKWAQACEIISDCERTVGHRDYLRVLVRNAPDAKPEAVVLDIAAL